MTKYRDNSEHELIAGDFHGLRLFGRIAVPKRGGKKRVVIEIEQEHKSMQLVETRRLPHSLTIEFEGD